MKHLQKIPPKHRNAFNFIPGNVAPPEMSSKIPAYNTQGKTFKRVLPAMRNLKLIDLNVLIPIIKEITPQNLVNVIPGGFSCNGNNVNLREGLATIEGMKFRYSDVYELLSNLIQAKMLDADKYELRNIRKKYYE
jgi:hypothetical protein